MMSNIIIIIKTAESLMGVGNTISSFELFTTKIVTYFRVSSYSIAVTNIKLYFISAP